MRVRIPKIEIEKQKGLSDKQVAEIKKNLEELAASKVGEVMIYELVQYVQVRWPNIFLKTEKVSIIRAINFDSIFPFN